MFNSSVDSGSKNTLSRSLFNSSSPPTTESDPEGKESNRDPGNEKEFRWVVIRYEMSVLTTSSFVNFHTFSFNTAISRKCYQCRSRYSWKACEDTQIKVECQTSQECITFSAHTSLADHVYEKGCAITCSAYRIAICRVNGILCKVQCCSSDYCNGGQSPTTATTKAPYFKHTNPTSGCLLLSASISIISFCFGLFALVFV